MRSLSFIMLSIIIFLSIEMTSCQLKKEAIQSNREDNEKIKLDFEILSDEISLDEIKEIESYKQKIIAYWNFEILATLKQINQTGEVIEVDDFLIYENFEIVNMKREPKDDLILFYDYSLVFDPETFETIGIRDTILKPNEYSIDSMNLVDDFRFYKSDPDTLLIRIKKQYFEQEIYSNWDTLIIK